MTDTLETAPAAATPGAGFMIRPFDLARDVDPLVRLGEEADAADGTEEAVGAEEWRVRLTTPEHDLTRDHWVVEAPDRPGWLVAEGASHKDTHAPGAWIHITVHPAWRRRGLGSAILDRALVRAREQGAAYVTGGANARVPAAEAFLRGHGFHTTSSWIEMRTARHLALPAPRVPDGYQMRTYADVQDPPALLTALNRGFIGHWEHHDETPESLAHWLAAPTTRPEGIFLAFGPAGDAAGLCWCDDSADRDARRGVPTGYIDALAVVPEHRRHGLGRALLLTGMRWLEGRGKEVYELGAWGENHMALPLYYDVGYAIAQQGREFRLDFAPGEQAG